MNSYYVYILTNWNNKVMYIGVTNNFNVVYNNTFTVLRMGSQRSITFINLYIMKLRLI